LQSLSQGSSNKTLLSQVPVALLIGDVLAFLFFVILGRASHGFTNDWLINVARIVTPFLMGWFIVALPIGAYRGDLLKNPKALLGRSTVAWLLGVLIAFGLRAYIFGNNVTLPFALTTIAFTALFVIGWRAVYLWWYNR
jgi:hypothetical protein